MGLECNVLILSNVTSAKVGINPQSFPTFALTFLAPFRTFSRPYLLPVLSYLTSAKTTPQKNRFF